MLSYRLALRLAGGLAWVLYHVDRRHRLVAMENLRHAFGDALNDGQRDETVRQVYRHFCTMLVEILVLPRKLHLTTWKKYAELLGGREVLLAIFSGRPVLIVTGHFGNWEIAGYALGLFGFETYAIARTLDNPYLERFLLAFRERTGQKILAKKGDFDNIQEVLVRGHVLATLADQDAGPRGQFVEFFNRPASTHKAVALLALEFEALMVVMGVPRLADCEVNGVKIDGPPRYYMTVSDVIDPREYAGRPDAVKAITERYTTALERVVRLAPEQYFWLHRRWKHQPAPRKGKKQAA
jgi:KDO2-lipid IV(A) lauroyltransferase